MDKIDKLNKAIKKVSKHFNAEPKLLGASLRILEYLFSSNTRFSIKGKRHLNFILINHLSEISRLKDKTEIMRVCNYLVSDECPVLIEKFEFIDGDYIIEIPTDEILEARKEGVFYHPQKGVPVDNFEAAICSHFSINPNFECNKGKATMAKKAEKQVTVFMHGKIYETTAKIARVFGEKRAQVVIERETVELLDFLGRDYFNETPFYIEGDKTMAINLIESHLNLQKQHCEQARVKYEALQNAVLIGEKYHRLLKETQQTNNEGSQNE